MKTKDFSQLLPYFEQIRKDQGRILVITHERPDGDAVGSSVAMWRLLQDNGYQADLMIPDQVPDAYQVYMPTCIKGVSTAELNGQYGLIVNTDASTIQRLGLGALSFDEIRIPFITFDHHPDNGIFGDVSYVDDQACSASEIVYSFAEYCQWKISPEAASLLLLGIVTDSGCFRFDNTTPQALRIAASLLEAGADHHHVVANAFFSKPFNMAMFESELFCSELKTAHEGKTAWVVIPPRLLRKYAVDIRNTETLIEGIRGIRGVQIAALIKSTDNPGIFKISLRSKTPEYSVGRIARRLNGGGHELAAGGTIFAKTPSEAEEILLKHIEMEIKKS